jgi:hypothetical protein
LALGPWAGGNVVVTTGYAMVGWIIAGLLIGVLQIFVRALTRVAHDGHGL